ncbi:MAG TPA: hypothetical protein GX701_03410 [Clostridiales bacterium]|jgi:hypothetical protein|nr:hypothetical protein [Clostridiales bacterium]
MHLADNSKLWIGAYYYDSALLAPEHMQKLTESFLDFLVVSNPKDELSTLLSLCRPYGIGIISSSLIPFWWGDEGDSAGQYGTKNVPAFIAQMDGTLQEDPLYWGDYLLDEPNAADFDAMQETIAAYKKRFPDKVPFVNLYPAYASHKQLGGTYEEHIRDYVAKVDTSYICYDYYPFLADETWENYRRNLKVVADACRESGRDFWLIAQAGAFKEEMPNETMIRHQGWMGLAFGMRALMHACYSPGWWHEKTSMVDKKGEDSQMFHFVRRLNTTLHRLSPVYMPYRNVGTYENPAHVPGYDIKADRAIVIGAMEKEGGRALVLANGENPTGPLDIATVSLALPENETATIYYYGLATRPVVENGRFTVTLPLGEGAFVVFEPKQ